MVGWKNHIDWEENKKKKRRDVKGLGGLEFGDKWYGLWDKIRLF